MDQFYRIDLILGKGISLNLRCQPTAPSLGTPNDYESHFLTLDAKAQRRVILQAPPVITASELKRIQNWLAVQFHVVDSLDETEPQQDLVEPSAS